MSLIVGCSPGESFDAAVGDQRGGSSSGPSLPAADDSSAELPQDDTEIGTVPTVREGTNDTVRVASPRPQPSLPPPTSSTTTTTTTSPTTTVAPTTTTTEPCQPPIPSDVLFDTDSAELRPEADDELGAAAETLLKDCPATKIVVIGHTDSRGTEEYNLDLSLRRAQAVIDWLVDFKLDPSILEARGAGESQLLEPDRSEDGTFIEEAGARNRRVEFEVIP